MESASEEMNFERAAVLRDQLHAVQSVQQRQNIVSKEGDFDVVGMSRLDEHAGLEIFYIRYGKMVGKENLSIPDSLHETDEDIIAAFIKILRCESIFCTEGNHTADFAAGIIAFNCVAVKTSQR